jgi:hypothetical protein
MDFNDSLKAEAHVYDQDGLRFVRNHEFMGIPRLVRGALILLDDHAYRGHRPEKVAMDRFAQTRPNKILSLPTGQGVFD